MLKLKDIIKNLINMSKANKDDFKLILLSIIMIIIDVGVLVLLYYFCNELCNFMDIRSLLIEMRLVIIMRICCFLLVGILLIISYLATGDILYLLGIRYENFINSELNNKSDNELD